MKKLAILFVMFAGFANAQSLLRVTNFSMATDTVTSSSTTLTLSNIVVVNESFLTAFNDSLNLGLGVLDSSTTVQFMDSAYVGVQSILVTDSVTILSADFNVSPALFKEGNNTVVIWPYSNGGATMDSLYFNMVYLGVNELTNNNLPVKIGPNPASEAFYLGDPQNLVKHVRIRSADGKFVRTVSTNTIVGIHDLENGIYLIELETNNGIFVKKLIIQK